MTKTWSLSRIICTYWVA